MSAPNLLDARSLIDRTDDLTDDRRHEFLERMPRGARACVRVTEFETSTHAPNETQLVGELGHAITDVMLEHPRATWDDAVRLAAHSVAARFLRALPESEGYARVLALADRFVVQPPRSEPAPAVSTPAPQSIAATAPARPDAPAPGAKMGAAPRTIEIDRRALRVPGPTTAIEVWTD